MKILEQFEEDCQQEKRSFNRHCFMARQEVYIHLVHKYGDIRVLNHKKMIRDILDKAGEEI